MSKINFKTWTKLTKLTNHNTKNKKPQYVCLFVWGSFSKRDTFNLAICGVLGTQTFVMMSAEIYFHYNGNSCFSRGLFRSGQLASCARSTGVSKVSLSVLWSPNSKEESGGYLPRGSKIIKQIHIIYQDSQGQENKIEKKGQATKRSNLSCYNLTYLSLYFF